MANNILSQDEVDALLNAVDQGELIADEDIGDSSSPRNGEMVTNYSFRRPNLITREQLRGIINFHDEFARELQSRLSISLRTNVDVRRVSAEQQQYNEFIFSLSDITHVSLFSANPLPGLALVEVNLSLVFGVVDLYLGGEGDVETSIRKPTEVELAILEPVMGVLYDCLENAFKSVIPVKFKTERFESTPEYVQAAPPDAPVVVLTFDVKIGLANGIINLCYPLPMIQKILREMTGKSGQLDNYYGKVRPIDSRRQVLGQLMKVPLSVSVDLGDAWIPAQEWLNLQKGDILLLNQEVGDTVQLEIEGRPFFEAYVGRKQSSLGVKVIKRNEDVPRKHISSLLEG